MNDHLYHIKQELLTTKKELVDRLSKSEYNMETSRENVFNNVSHLYEQEKSSMLHLSLREELEDVNRALLKMDVGLYGVCERTGKQISLDELKIMPTARTVAEASLPTIFKKEQRVTSHF